MELTHSQIAPSPNLDEYLSSDIEYYNLLGGSIKNKDQRGHKTNHLQASQNNAFREQVPPILTSKHQNLFQSQQHPTAVDSQEVYYSPGNRRGGQQVQQRQQHSFGRLNFGQSPNGQYTTNGLASVRSSGDFTPSRSPFDPDNRLTRSGYSTNLQVGDLAGISRQIRRLAQNNQQRNNNQRSSSDYNMLSEFIGIRRSLKNINYRQMCMMCSENRTSIPCPQCGVFDSSRNRSHRSQNELSSHRSLNSCQFRKISPIVEDHFTPRGLGNHEDHHQHSRKQFLSCSQVQSVAQQRADEARRSHRRFEMRTLSPMTQQDTRSPQNAKMVAENQGHGRRRSSGQYRLQPSQTSPMIGAGAASTNKQYSNLQEYVLIENGRHGSCAIQQPCNFCGNADCFSPINGSNTCCFELLQEQQEKKKYQGQQMAPEQSTVKREYLSVPPQIQTQQQYYQEQSSVVEVIPEENFVILRDSHRQRYSAIQEEPILENKKKQKKPAPRIMVQAGVQTIPSETKPVKQKRETAVQVQAISSAEDSKKPEHNIVKKARRVATNNAKIQTNQMMTASFQSTASQNQKEINRGNYDLQKRIAMLNKLCVFHLNRSTQHGQTKEQTRMQLEKNRELFNQCQKILNFLKQAFDETEAVKGEGGLIEGREINSRTEPLDEDIILRQLKVRCDAILVPHVALFKFFKLPAKLEGNLVLITYLLNNSLDAIFDRLKPPPVISLPQLYAVKGHSFDTIVHEIDQYYCKELRQSYEAPPEPQVELSNFEMEQEEFSSGLADSNPVELSKQSNSRNQAGRKADLASFDREKFYKRLGVDLNEAQKVKEEDDGCMMVAEVCTSEYGSVGLADSQEVTIEKSIDTTKLHRRADMIAFDREAFYKRQGYSDDQPPPMLERRISTVEFEQDLADHIPVELTKKIDPKRRQRVPDMVNRDAFYKRLGVDVSQSLSDPVATYEVPTLKPLMQSLQYQALKFEEKRTTESQQEDCEIGGEEEEEEESSIGEGNIETNDQEMVAQKLVQSSNLDQKIKLNDYIFDERQNIDSDLSKFVLKSLVRQKRNVQQIHNLMPPQTERKDDSQRSRSSSLLLSPQTYVRYMQAGKDESGRRSVRNVYLDENYNATINNAVNFVSPVNRLGGKRSWNERQAHFERKYGSPGGAQPPIAEDSTPYQPHGSKIRRGAQFSYPSTEGRTRSGGVGNNPKQSQQAQFKTGESKTLQTPNSNVSGINRFQFPKTMMPEDSTPQVKLESDQNTISDRLKYNKDRSAMNQNKIDIDDDGNMNMRVTPSPSPSPSRPPINARNEASDSSVDEARTFVSSHLLFSHLMSIDAKKNTLSQLNKSSQKNCVTKSITQQARDHGGGRGGPEFGSSSHLSHYISPIRSRAGSRGVAPMSNLSRLLSGGARSKITSPVSRNVSYLSAAGGGLTENQSMDVGSMPQPIVKHATRIKGQSFASYVSPSSMVRQASPPQFLKETNSSEFKQHTFYPIQLQQIIPETEQLNEETQRNVQMTTANFRRDNFQVEASKIQLQRPSQGNISKDEIGEGVDMLLHQDAVLVVDSQRKLTSNRFDKRESTTSAGGFDRYLQAQGNSKDALSFVKYLDKNGNVSGSESQPTEGVLTKPTPRDQFQPTEMLPTKPTPRDQPQQNTLQTNGPIPHQYTANMQGMLSASLRDQKPSYRLPQSRQSNRSNSRERVVNAYYSYQSGQDGLFNRPVSHSQRMAGVMSRQTDQLRSELGRSTIGDNSMMVIRKKHAVESRGPITGDIQPVFRLIKAQPITPQGDRPVRAAQIQERLNICEEEKPQSVAVGNSQQFMHRQILFGNNQVSDRPKSSKTYNSGHIKIENFDDE